MKNYLQIISALTVITCVTSAGAAEVEAPRIVPRIFLIANGPFTGKDGQGNDITKLSNVTLELTRVVDSSNHLRTHVVINTDISAITHGGYQELDVNLRDAVGTYINPTPIIAMGLIRFCTSPGSSHHQAYDYLTDYDFTQPNATPSSIDPKITTLVYDQIPCP